MFAYIILMLNALLLIRYDLLVNGIPRLIKQANLLQNIHYFPFN